MSKQRGRQQGYAYIGLYVIIKGVLIRSILDRQNAPC